MGGVGGLRLRPLFACFVPSIAVPYTAAQVVLDQIDLPTSCPSLLSPSIPADDEAYALIHGDASSTSPSTSLRPKHR